MSMIGFWEISLNFLKYAEFKFESTLKHPVDYVLQKVKMTNMDCCNFLIPLDEVALI